MIARLAGLALVAALALPAAGEETHWLVGGELHVGNGRVISDAVIGIRGERIVEVGGAGALPEGARAIDLSGRWITPGLVAAATTLGLVEIAAEPTTRDLAREGTGPIRASYDPARLLRTSSSLLPVQAIEGVTTAAVNPIGGLLSGQVAWIDLTVDRPEEALFQRRIAQNGSLGRAVGETPAAGLALLRRLLHDARFLEGNRARFERRALRDLAAHPIELEALVPVVDRTVPLTVAADGAGAIRALLELSEELGIRLVIKGGAEAWRVADLLAEAGVPVILTPSRNVPWSFDALGARLDNAARLSRAGVRIAITTLDGAHNVRNLTQEAGIAVANGLDWEAALSAVTLDAARIYGMERFHGSVEVGKFANLVAWDGDPFELEHFARRVWVRGREIPLVSRQTLLRERYRDPAGGRR